MKHFYHVTQCNAMHHLIIKIHTHCYMEKNHFIKQIRKEAGASLNYTLSEYTQWMIYIENHLLRKA